MVGRILLISQNFGHYRFWAKIRYELRYHNWGVRDTHNSVYLVTKWLLFKRNVCLSDATAIGGESQNDGSDYIKLEGTLWFRHGEAAKTIDLVINPNAHVRIWWFIQLLVIIHAGCINRHWLLQRSLKFSKTTVSSWILINHNLYIGMSSCIVPFIVYIIRWVKHVRIC